MGAFTVIGVIAALECGASPLWLWGALMGAITGAGGGILRDVVRADVDNPGLKGMFYAEIALVWGLALSVFLAWYSSRLEYHPTHINTAVLVTLLGASATRLLVYHLKIRSPMY